MQTLPSTLPNVASGCIGLLGRMDEIEGRIAPYEEDGSIYFHFISFIRFQHNKLRK